MNFFHYTYVWCSGCSSRDSRSSEVSYAQDLLSTNTDTSGGEGKPPKGPTQEETYALKQAVAAAAVARQAKSYDTSKSKLIRRKEKRLEEQKRQHQQPQQRNESEETRRAIAAIKQAERSRAATNGFNPYETRKLTSGQVFST